MNIITVAPPRLTKNRRRAGKTRTKPYTKRLTHRGAKKANKKVYTRKPLTLLLEDN